MSDCDIIDNIKAIIGQLIVKKGFVLVDIKLHNRGKEKVLSILTDRSSGGITIAECTMINKEIQMVIDDKAILDDPYSLEVSSPGINRPLCERADFLRVIGVDLRVFLKDSMSVDLEENKEKEIEGKLAEVTADSIKIDTQDGILIIPMTNILTSKQIV